MLLLRFNKSEPGLTIRIVGAGARVHALFRTRAVRRGNILPLCEPKSQLLRHLRVVLVMYVVEHAAPSHFHLQPSAYSLQPCNPTLTHKLQGVQSEFTSCPCLRHEATCVSASLEAFLNDERSAACPNRCRSGEGAPSNLVNRSLGGLPS